MNYMTLKIYQLDFFIDLSGNLVDAMIGFWLKAENRLGFQKTLNSFFYSDNFIKLKGRHPLDSYEELGQIAFENFEEAKRVESREVERLVEDDYFIIEFKEESFECWKDFFDLVENKKFLLWCPGNIEAISLEKLNNKNSHPVDESGKSKVTEIRFEFNSGDRVTVEMTDWSKKIGYYDNIRVNIDTKEIAEWLYNNTYK